jgi:hypothetical protein
MSVKNKLRENKRNAFFPRTSSLADVAQMIHCFFIASALSSLFSFIYFIKRLCDFLISDNLTSAPSFPFLLQHSCLRTLTFISNLETKHFSFIKLILMQLLCLTNANRDVLNWFDFINHTLYAYSRYVQACVWLQFLCSDSAGLPWTLPVRYIPLGCELNATDITRQILPYNWIFRWHWG